MPSNAMDFRVIPCSVGGKDVELPESQNFPVVTSRTGNTAHYFQSADVATANAACAAAMTAFKTSKRSTTTERRALLNRFADALEARAADATQRQQLETSCDQRWAHSQVALTAEMIREIACAIASVTGTIAAQDSNPNVTSLVFKEPIGPVLVIAPWNGALILAMRGVANAIAAGCTVVLKASELCPWSHRLSQEIMQEINAPPGILNTIQCARPDAAAVTEAMIAHPSIRKVEFTGSAGVGKVIGALAGKHLKPVLMELGDQSPAIVLDDADLQAAARKCAFGVVFNQGQACVGTERIIVQASVKDEFIKHLTVAVSAMPAMGHTVSAAAAKRGKDILDEAIADGATLVVGKTDIHDNAMLSHSILTDINPKSRLVKQETFTPSASLNTVESEEEAIEIANDTDYGLSASVHTGSYERGLRMARELEFGSVQINEMTIFGQNNTPVTGYKGSGWGNNGGRFGIEEFTFNKYISLRSQGADAGFGVA